MTKELHEYVRHIFGALVTWFCFFVMFNYTTMGLILNAAQKLEGQSQRLTYMSWMFEWQVFLGIVACVVVIAGIRGLGRRIREAAVSSDCELPQESRTQYVPIWMYVSAAVLMILGLLPIMAAWWYIPSFIK